MLVGLTQSCAPTVPYTAAAQFIETTISVSTDHSTVTATFTGSFTLERFNAVNSVLISTRNQYITTTIQNELKDDSLAALVIPLVQKDFTDTNSCYSLTALENIGESVTAEFRINVPLIRYRITPILERYGHPEDIPIHPLFTKKYAPPSPENVKGLNLLLPSAATAVPQQASRLPNAPRVYRNGIHRGIDFVVEWGTPVRAVADGIVVRADHGYKEFLPEFRQQMLAVTDKLHQTPSDIFEYILLGRTIFIDHGFDLVPGYRALSVYAHLEHIEKNITPGTRVSMGQILGQSGNSGTEDGALGQRTGAHLHWELLLQDKGGEYYLGQGWNTATLKNKLTLIFNK